MTRRNEVIHIDIEMNSRETLFSIRELVQGLETLNTSAVNVSNSIRRISAEMQTSEAPTNDMRANIATLGSALGILNAGFGQVNEGSRSLMNSLMATEVATTILTSSTRILQATQLTFKTVVDLLRRKITFQTAAFQAATAAAVAHGAALKLLPFVKVAAIIGAVVAVGVTFSRWLNQGTEESRRLSSEQERLRGNIENLTQSINENKNAFAGEIQEINSNAGANRRLAEEVNRLAGIQNKSAEERARMHAYINMLNGSMEGLNLQYDEEGRQLNLSLDLINARIDAMEQQAKANATQERLTEILREQMDIEFQLEEVNRKREKWLELGEEGLLLGAEEIRNRREARKATEELDEKEEVLLETQARLAEKYDHTSQIMIDSILAVTEATEAGVLSKKEAYESLYPAQRELVDRMVEYWNHYRDSGREMFSQLGTATKLYTYVADSEGNKVRTGLRETGASHEEVMEAMIENMRHNRKAMQEWSNNLTYIANEFCAEFAASLRELGPEAAAYVYAMANGCEKKLQELVNEFHKAGEYATENITNAIGEGHSDVVGMVEYLGTGMYQSLKQEVNNANFKGLGLSITDGLVDGIKDGQDDLNGEMKDTIKGAEKSTKDAAESNSPSRVFIRIANSLMQGLVKGVQDDRPKLVRELGNLRIDFEKVGRDATDGLNVGLNRGRSTVLNTARSLANEVTRTMQRALSINSPSRVMRDKIGKFIPEGIAVGIEAESGTVMGALEGLSDDMIKIPKISPESLIESSRSGFSIPTTTHPTHIANYNSTNNEGLFNGATIIWKGKEDIRQTMQEIAWVTQTEGARL